MEPRLEVLHERKLDCTVKGKLILTVGLPASGKSTWAASVPDAVVLERDILRMGMSEGGDITQYKYTKEKERGITKEQTQSVNNQLMNDHTVIVADTNINGETRNNLAAIGVSYGVEVVLAWFDTPLKTCVERNIKRNKPVPEAVIVRMEKELRALRGKFVQDGRRNPKHLPRCVIVDVDGTLADMKGVRGPFEWDKVGDDFPRTHVLAMVDAMKKLGYTVIVFSGRDGVCYDETEKWLNDFHVPFDELYLRAEGSFRPDTKVKEEMFDKYVKDKYHVITVFDDRKCVCMMWESMGLPVTNVGGFLSDF